VALLTRHLALRINHAEASRCSPAETFHTVEVKK
jgi:hypothetical protein